MAGADEELAGAVEVRELETGLELDGLGEGCAELDALEDALALDGLDDGAA